MGSPSMSTTPGGRRFLDRARRVNYGTPAPAPPAAGIADDPPVPRGFRGWPGQVDFPDLTPDEIAARYLNGGSARREQQEQEQSTKRLVRAWLAARQAPAQERKRKSK
jgi:HAMP domain-containing protein